MFPIMELVKLELTNIFSLSHSLSVIDCGSLDPPMNGRVETPQGTTFGSEALYSCRAGYEVNGATVRECTQSEDWSGSEPTCSRM